MYFQNMKRNFDVCWEVLGNVCHDFQSAGALGAYFSGAYVMLKCLLETTDFKS